MEPGGARRRPGLKHSRLVFLGVARLTVIGRPGEGRMSSIMRPFPSRREAALLLINPFDSVIGWH
jgi:hypothetical protein